MVLHWDDVAWEPVDRGELRWDRQRLVPGLSRYRVPPGRRLMPAHVHVDEEEYVVVLGGSGLSWQDGTAHPVARDDVILHRADAEVHTLIAGDEGLEVLIFSTGSPTGLTRLPRAGVLRAGKGWWPYDVADPFAAEPPLEPPPVSDERPPNIVAMADVPATPEGVGRFAGDDRELGMALGAVLAGLHHDVLPPGHVSCPLHHHTAESEKFVVVGGGGFVRLGDERHPLQPGSVVDRPAGTGVGHALHAGDEGLVYLCWGTRDEADACAYPDSGKLLVAGVMFRPEPLHYWDGEVLDSPEA
jgi:uncharacterized cupin superfamily protein